MAARGTAKDRRAALQRESLSGCQRFVLDNAQQRVLASERSSLCQDQLADDLLHTLGLSDNTLVDKTCKGPIGYNTRPSTPRG